MKGFALVLLAQTNDPLLSAIYIHGSHIIPHAIAHAHCHVPCYVRT
jgi:hypothetical protein